jgi:hypothetical protein
MSRSWRIVLGIAAVLSVPAAAHAFGGCMWYAPSYYYWPTPMYYYYVPQAQPRVVPVPDAKTTSAKKVDKSDRAPVIVTNRAMPAGSASTAKERVKIGFWNLTNRDISITVAGKTRSLAKNRSMKLELEREFAWQVDGRSEQIERVPDGLATYEVLVRE